ncbi:MAG: hypothetical protein RSA29_16495 [Clostridium sp.]
MEKFINWVLIYLVVVMPFLFMLYFVIKKAVKDGMDDHERYNKK